MDKNFSARNVGGTDLIIRAFIGCVGVFALALHLVPPQWVRLVALISFVGLFTSITRRCLLYVLFGFSTAKKKQR
ncbi:MAG: DUF2892 domain-containing protein [Methanobacteriota archaeon]